MMLTDAVLLLGKQLVMDGSMSSLILHGCGCVCVYFFFCYVCSFLDFLNIRFSIILLGVLYLHVLFCFFFLRPIPISSLTESRNSLCIFSNYIRIMY